VGYFGIFSAVLDGNPDDIAGFFKEFFKENATLYSFTQGIIIGW